MFYRIIRHRGIIIFCVIAVLYVILLFAGVQQWDNYDGFGTHLVTGVATKNALLYFYIFGAWGIAPFFQWLQPLLPGVNAVGLMATFLMILTATTFTWSLLQQIIYKNLKAVAVVLTLIIFILLPAFFTPSLTGMSFLLCGAGLILATTVKETSLLKKNLLQLLGFVLYVIGFCFRLESGMGASLIVGVFLLLFLVDVKKTIVRLIPFVLAASAITCISLRSLNEIPFLKATEGVLYYVADGTGNNGFHEGVSVRDSIKLKAVQNFFINDEEEITPPFIVAMAKMKMQQEKKFSLKLRLEAAWLTGGITISKNFQFVLFNFLLVGVLLFTGCRSWRIVFFQIFFWLVVGALAYLLKLEDRHFIYMAQLYSFGNLLFCAQGLGNNNKPDFSLRTSAGIIFSFLFFFSLTKELKAVPGIRQNLNNLQLAEKEINRLAEGKILMLDGDSKNIFDGSPLSLRKFSTVKNIVYYDMGEMPFLPPYNKFLDEVCQCNSHRPVDFFGAWYKRKNELLIISNERRMRFLESYLNIVHHKSIIFEKVQGSYEVQKIGDNADHLNYYTIKKFE